MRTLLTRLRGVGTSLLRPSDPSTESSSKQTSTEKLDIRRMLIHWAVLLAILGGGGLFMSVAGLVPIAASSGHWPITEWFLGFTMRRAVATQSMAIETPSIDDNRLVLMGAGHFETGCRPCHGSPQTSPPRIAARMTPTPPNLATSALRWDPEELFYIVKHGIKFTGMPAWPALDRDDEVWAMVAFLRRLPELDADGYRQLVYGEQPVEGAAAPLEAMVGAPAMPPSVVASCVRCHGSEGIGRGPGAFPVLAGQKPAYLESALEAYANNTRHSGMMGPIAANLSRDDIRQLARYYANLPPPRVVRHANSQAISRGELLATAGKPSQRLPACHDCHSPTSSDANPHYPILAGQNVDYLINQLKLFHSRTRGGGQFAHLMYHVAPHLRPEQTRDVAHFYASLSTREEATGRSEQSP